MLILNTKDEVVEGRSLATFLQEAVTQDDIGVLKRFKAACEVLYEKEEKASKEKRLLASMHQRYWPCVRCAELTARCDNAVEIQ